MLRRLVLAVVLASAFLVVPVRSAMALPPPGQALVRNAVVDNTNPNLANTDGQGDGETSIAVNPLDPDEIVITAFSGCWNACGTTNAPLFHSTDGGVTWTKRFTIPPPPGQPAAIVNGCPCDQTIDFDRQGNLFASFLLTDGSGGVANHNVVTGSTDDPADASRWQWNGNPVQATDIAGSQNPDQNWLIVNRSSTNVAVDNVYVAYDDFDVNPRDTRVAVSSNAVPPNFTVDNDAGDASTSGVNPGLRMAGDPSSGHVYVMYQQGDTSGITWRLNRSTDDGASWSLNGDANGIVVGSGPSRQGPTNGLKFGDVNALIGGVNHLTVDPNTGDVLVVYGTSSDPANTNGNHLFVRRILNDPGDTMTPQAPVQITAAENAALPSIAVTADGTIGVFYYTFDEFDGDGFPVFSTHFARSHNGGASFGTLLLQTFTAPVQDNMQPRQRIFFDYHQTKAVGNFFYGAYTGGGEEFGHPDTPNSVAELDPIFFSVPSGQVVLCPPWFTPTITGTPGNDNLTGTAGPDVIFGLNGNDKISGLGGNDVICGGDGNDELTGDDGDDQIFGDQGADKVTGGAGDDYLGGGPGVDQLTGGAGDDIIDLIDSAGGDTASGGPHVTADTCVGDGGDSIAGDCNP